MINTEFNWSATLEPTSRTNKNLNPMGMAMQTVTTLENEIYYSFFSFPNFFLCISPRKREKTSHYYLRKHLHILWLFRIRTSPASWFFSGKAQKFLFFSFIIYCAIYLSYIVQFRDAFQWINVNMICQFIWGFKDRYQ